MALTQEDLQAIGNLMDAKLEQALEPLRADITGLQQGQTSIQETQAAHTASIVQLENNVTHELRLLSENLPSAIARHEAVETLETTVENHAHRIFALEQRASNG